MEARRNRGELESRLLRILWDSPKGLTAREIVGSFVGGEGVPTMSTVLTVLDRMAKKGIVRRSGTSGEYVFEPVESESAFTARAMTAALSASADRAGALTYFAGTLDPGELGLLRRVLGPAGPGGEDS